MRKPPFDFGDLIRKCCIDADIEFDIDGIQGKHRFKYFGPWVHLIPCDKNLLPKIFDFRAPIEFFTSGLRQNSLKIQEKGKGDAQVALGFGDIIERDLNYVKLSIWASYWESIRTNGVNIRQRRDARPETFKHNIVHKPKVTD